MQRTLTASQLCSVNSSSLCLTPFQLWPPLLNSSQAISALLNFRNSFQQLSKLFHHLSSTLLTSSLLFSTLLNDSHLCPHRLNSFQLVSALLTSWHLFNSSHLFSPPLNSSHLFLSSSHLLNSGQLFSTLLTSCHRDAYTQSKLLHGETLTQRSA